MEKIHLNYVAAASYSCGAYGAGGFSSDCATSTGASGSSPGTRGGILADTGYGVILPVALGAAIVFAAVVLLVKRLRRRAAASRVE